MPRFLLYILYTAALWGILFAAVPRKHLRELVIYGIIFGAMTDGILIILVSFILHLGEYINIGPLGFRGLPLFPLVAWTAYYILYFYHLPDFRLFRYVYMIAAIAMCILFSNVLMNLGIFRWQHGRLLIPSILYTVWTVTATWGYGKLRALERRKKEE